MSGPLLHLVLFEPEIPQNTGNIGRTCVALGVKLWLVQPLGFQLDSRRLARAGLDYWEDLQWEVVPNWDDLQDRLPAETRMWYFSKRGDRVYTEALFSREDVLVFGSESRGLPQSLLARYADQVLKIPQPGPVRSLNVANAAAVAMYEAYRQLALV